MLESDSYLPGWKLCSGVWKKCVTVTKRDSI